MDRINSRNVVKVADMSAANCWSALRLAARAYSTMSSVNGSFAVTARHQHLSVYPQIVSRHFA